MKSPDKKTPPGVSEQIKLPDHLRARLDSLAAGMGCGFDEALAKTVTSGLDFMEAERVASSAEADLSPRQSAILQGLRDGLAIKEIAGKLAISEVTVRTHIVRIRERLNCPDLLKLRMP